LFYVHDVEPMVRFCSTGRATGPKADTSSSKGMISEENEDASLRAFVIYGKPHLQKEKTT